MAIRPVLTIDKHEKILRTKSQPVKKVDRSIKNLIQDILDTIADNPAAGLAAPQIGVLKRVIGVRLSECEDEDEEKQNSQPPLILINPEIVAMSDEFEHEYDGCLSIPGMMGYTDRKLKIQVKYLDEKGVPQDREFTGWDARVIQHEVDHLDGILFIDRLNSFDDLYVLVEGKDGKIKRVPYLKIVEKSGGNPMIGAKALPGA